MSQSVCRWGFLSTANISRKNWKAVRLSGNSTVSAVASRTAAKAQQFIDDCADECPMNGPVEAIGSYEELIASENVDVVYLPIPTGIRKEWVIQAAEAGKHILCEKPIANHADDAQAMIDACAANGVQFMDGVMFDHSRRLAELCRILKEEKTIGKLRRINTQFCFSSDIEFQTTNIRTDSALEPHGCLGDVGWYCIRFILWAARLREPTHVTARTLTALQGRDSAGEVPGEFSGELQFDDGLSATFYCSFLTENQQTAVMSGDKGYISVDDFVLPFYDAEAKWAHHNHVLDIDNCRWNFRRHTAPQAIAEYPGGEPNAQEVNMVRNMADCVLSGKLNPLYPELSIKTQRILDACRRSDAAGGEKIAVH
jgi:predicted dehydrogenase